MNTQNTHSRTIAWKLWRRNGLIWAALMLLLALTLVFAYVPMGLVTPAAGIVIAFVKAGLVILLFMELAKARPLDPPCGDGRRRVPGRAIRADARRRVVAPGRKMTAARENNNLKIPFGSNIVRFRRSMLTVQLDPDHQLLPPTSIGLPPLTRNRFGSARGSRGVSDCVGL
jgi:hypothetical protein